MSVLSEIEKRIDSLIDWLTEAVERAEENARFSRYISGEMQGAERKVYAANRLNDYADLAHEYDSGSGGRDGN